MLTCAAAGLIAAAAAASTVGVLAGAADGLTVAAGGAAVSTAGVGATASAAGVAGDEDGLTVAAGAAASTAAVLAGALGDGVVVVGSMTVCEYGTTAPTVAAAAAAQCSEIMLNSVTAKLLSAAPELTVPPDLCPVSFTSWPTCGLRSTMLVLILMI